MRKIILFVTVVGMLLLCSACAHQHKPEGEVTKKYVVTTKMKYEYSNVSNSFTDEKEALEYINYYNSKNRVEDVEIIFTQKCSICNYDIRVPEPKTKE